MSVFRYQGQQGLDDGFYLPWSAHPGEHGNALQRRSHRRSKTSGGGHLEEGAAGIRKHQQPRLLSVAADEWLDLKKSHSCAEIRDD